MDKERKNIPIQRVKVSARERKEIHNEKCVRDTHTGETLKKS